MVESNIVGKIDKDLCITSVVTACGQSYGPTPVRLQVDLVPRIGAIPGVLVCAWAATLDHKVRLPPVKREAIEVAVMRELYEPLDVSERDIGKGTDNDLTTPLHMEDHRGAPEFI